MRKTKRDVHIIHSTQQNIFRDNYRESEDEGEFDGASTYRTSIGTVRSGANTPERRVVSGDMEAVDGKKGFSHDSNDEFSHQVEMLFDNVSG
jgi:hypothetical protein